MTTPPPPLSTLLHRGLLQILGSADVEALSAWNLVGVSLFPQEKLPTLRELTKQAQKVLLRLIIERYDGNITHGALALGISRRSLRMLLQQAGLYERCKSIQTSEAPNRRSPGSEQGVPAEVLVGEEDDTIPISVKKPGTREVTREAIAEVAARLHPAAFVYMEQGQPVLVDDGLAWLLFFDDWWNGCQCSCDGEDIGLLHFREQLEMVLKTMAETYAETDEHARDAATRHTAEIAQLSGAEVYRRARAHAKARFERR